MITRETFQAILHLLPWEEFRFVQEAGVAEMYQAFEYGHVIRADGKIIGLYATADVLLGVEHKTAISVLATYHAWDYPFAFTRTIRRVMRDAPYPPITRQPKWFSRGIEYDRRVLGAVVFHEEPDHVWLTTP